MATEARDGEAYAGYSEEEEEEYEVEEIADDTPMRIHERVFLGSIDAARNLAALERANVGITLALLGADDERVGSSDDAVVSRVFVAMEDALDEPLFERLPALLATLKTTLSDAEKRDCNVLVHCMAGRSRSPSLVAAWLMVTQSFTLQQALDRIQLVRPWIDINNRFLDDLKLFEAVQRGTTDDKSLSKAPLTHLGSVLPRLDFGQSLVPDILANIKTVTMRLMSDVENDKNSDLGRISPHSTVRATTASRDLESQRDVFAFLRIDRVDAGVPLTSVEEATLHKTGFTSKEDVLSVLKIFYPDITMQTPLLMLHFTCISAST